MRHRRPRRSTPAGDHRPVLLAEVLAALDPKPGATAVDCTVGRAGHSAELLRRVGPTGKLIGLDLDPENLPAARAKLEALGLPFALHHGNFAGLPAVLAAEGVDGADALVADLGMSSMQVDDAGRGFSFARDGPLDMRMDRTRGRTAAELLATLPAAELAAAFRDLGDEPQAEAIAAAVVAARSGPPLARTGDLAELVQRAAPVRVEPESLGHGTARQQRLRPAARVFQALRILVNRELANLQQLLRVLPGLLRPGGRAAIISFHSGEDRLVKAAFRDGVRAGLYAAVSEEPVRPGYAERTANPRARSAKLRWARKA
jgi:16S rRNA (cytosine1402-N4)-methyltransferase